ncbi:MAG: hypothetical protein NC820_00230 [Candidatus Omnitrophica bacterium]|nr:hypothetical protein [Candidatus Omnitrophota bacterium]
MNNNNPHIADSFAQKIYNGSPYKLPANMLVRIGDNLEKVSLTFALDVIGALQFYRDLPLIVVCLCAGNTPLLGYRKVGGSSLINFRDRAIKRNRRRDFKLRSILDTWDTSSTQKLLRLNGLDTKYKPDMKKVVVFSIDEIFPRKREDVFSFARLLNETCELWGIEKQNRNFFYGDLYVFRDNNRWVVEEIKDEEFTKIINSIEKEGLKILEYQAHCLLKNDREGFSLNSPLRIERNRVVFPRLKQNKRGDFILEETVVDPLNPNHIQYRYIDSMRNQAIMMDEKLKNLGGPHITVLGVGPCELGEGHIGFCERDTLPQQTSFIGAINDYDRTYHISSYHSKEFYGFKNMFVTVGDIRMPKLGFITFGPQELIYGYDRKKPSPKIIIIATGINKSTSILKALESNYDTRYPLALSRNSYGLYVLDKSAGRELRLLRFPWEFGVLPLELWDDNFCKEYLISLAKFFQSSISKLDVDFNNMYKRLFDSSKIHICKKNAQKNFFHFYKAIKQKGYDFDDFKKKIIEHILANTIFPYQIKEKLEKLGIKEKDRILLINPHMDDEFLALAPILREMAKYYRVYSVYLSGGYHGVYSDYVFDLLDTAINLKNKYIVSLNISHKEDLLKELVRNKFLRVIPHLDYQITPYMSEEEKKLRAKLLIIDLNERSKLVEGYPKIKIIKDIKDIVRLKEFLAAVEERKKYIYSEDIEVMRFIKSSLRFNESVSLLMCLGLPYNNVYPPMDNFGCNQRRNEYSEYITKIKNLIASLRPKMLMINGDGYNQANTHYYNQIFTYLALKDLVKNKSIRKDTLIFQWGGVWDRFSIGSSQLNVILSKEELDNFKHDFNYFYPTQSPYAPIPNPTGCSPRSFSEDFIKNAKESSKELTSLIDLQEDILKIFKEGGGLISYRIGKLKDVIKQNFLLIESFKDTYFTLKPNILPPQLDNLDCPIIAEMISKEVIYTTEEKKVFGYGDSFSLSVKDLVKIVYDFHRDMEYGLEGKKSSLAMLPTFVDISTGKEEGLFLALDLGGSTLRIMALNLKRGKKPKLIIERFNLRNGKKNNLNFGKADDFFGTIAKRLKWFISKYKSKLIYDKPYPLGFTFSFPVRHISADKAILKRWSKDFSIPEVINKDVVSFLRRAIDKEGLSNLVKVVSLNNDTVATLVAKSYFDSNCDIGGIIGTGTNFCYRERVKNIHKLSERERFRYRRERMIINIESGNFNKLPRNIYDIKLDEASSNRGKQIEEKMVSGLYLGELTRLVLLDLIEKRILFKGKLSLREKESILIKNSFPTPFMTDIAIDNTPTFKIIKDSLIKWGINERRINLEDRLIVKDVCKKIACRSARLSAAIVFAIVTHIDKDIDYYHTVAIDGSLFSKYPHFKDDMEETLRELSWEIFAEDRSHRIKLELTSDGSGIGAGIIAAVEVS